MIRITCGTCGTSQGYKTAADGVLSLPAAEERRLVSRGVADYVTRPITGEALNAPPVPSPGGVEPEGASQDTLGAEPPAEAPTGGNVANLDEVEIARLERMQKTDLEQMAADMGLDITGAKTKRDLAVLIVEAEGLDNGDAPPDLGAGDIVQ